MADDGDDNDAGSESYTGEIGAGIGMASVGLVLIAYGTKNSYAAKKAEQKRKQQGTSPWYIQKQTGTVVQQGISPWYMKKQTGTDGLGLSAHQQLRAMYPNESEL